jgi:serralysin
MNSAPSFAPALNNVTAGTYNWLAIFHEIGHTLGLKHPGDYNAGGGGTPGPYLPEQQDNQQYTVMSYFQGSGGGYDSSYMLYDVAALQYLYGINKSGTTAVTGAFTFNSSTTSYGKTLWSTNGKDVINLTGLKNASLVNLNAGTYSSINIQGANNFTGGGPIGKNNVAIAYGSSINRVTLDPAASITDEVILNDAYKNSQFNIIQNLTSTDKIGISASIFGDNLGSYSIQIGTTDNSTSSTYKIIVNTATKNIYYDSDGLGGSAAVKIAKYTAIGGFSLSAANNFDFVA